MRQILLAAVIALMPLAAIAQDLDKGSAAYNAGDYATAAEQWRPLAEQGDMYAQFNLAFMYGEGKGVPQDYVEAVRWYRMAAEQGLADAQYNLGNMYYRGDGVPQDYVEAVRWYRLAAEQGDATAQSDLGLMYALGWGVPQDYVEAAQWYRLAADQGYALAQANLGRMYHEGLGVPQDHAEATRWFRLAAMQGLAGAQYSLGVMYFTGLGGPQDFLASYMWHSIAFANDSNFGRKNVDEIAKGMTPEQIAEAQRRAKVCMESGYTDCYLPTLSETNVTANNKRYRNSHPRWTVIYPAKWKRRRQDSITVEFRPANGLALCGIHVTAVRHKSLKEFVDFSLAYGKKHLESQGSRQVVRGRRGVKTPTGRQGVEVQLDIVPGGRSRRIYLFDAPIAYVIDCETSADKWSEFSSDFDMIQRSFDLE